jgi:tRNA dimethylallyltransferase
MRCSCEDASEHNSKPFATSPVNNSLSKPMLSVPRWTCLALLGPTAAGKSSLAMALAQRWPIEIISMDSALVYQGMDIGSAKPSAAELALVPHHLINIRTVDKTYSAAEFAKDAQLLIEQIRQRQRVPVLVGGTMLYFKALSDGLDELPKSDPVIREALAKEAHVLGWAAMHEQLARVDPQTAARLAPGDSQRISRALEVWRISGQPLSSFQSKYKAQDSSELGSGNKDLAHELRAASSEIIDFTVGQAHGHERFLVLSLEPLKRAWLHERIHRRLQAMLDAGFLQEVQDLVGLPEVNGELPSMKSVGYRQAYELWLELQKKYPQASRPLTMPGIHQDVAYQHFVELAQTATRQLAKRQLTWLRSLPTRKIVQCDDTACERDALDFLESIKGGYASLML